MLVDAVDLPSRSQSIREPVKSLGVAAHSHKLLAIMSAIPRMSRKSSAAPEV